VAPPHGNLIVAARLTPLSFCPSPGTASSYRRRPGREQGPAPCAPGRAGRDGRGWHGQRGTP